jgi:hypothetical protein
MAEIKIQEKKRGMWWLWLLLLIPLIWFLMRNRKDDDTATTVDSTAVASTNVAGTGAGATVGADSSGAMTTAGAGVTAAAFTDYSTFIAVQDANRDDKAQHEFTANGLRRLAAAIDASSAGAGAASQTATMRAMADSLQVTSSGNDRHADMARRAMEASLAPLGQLAGGSASAVESAAKSLSPSKKLLAQKDNVQRYFDAARDVLQTAGSAAPKAP